MNAIAPLAAELLEASSAGFAAAANARLQSRWPAGAERDSVTWQRYLEQRVLELAAAIRVGEPRLFMRRVAWLRRAAQARRVDDTEILLALESLKSALETELPAPVAAEVAGLVDLALSDAAAPVAAETPAVDAETPAGRLALEYIGACLDSGQGDPVTLVMQAIEAGLAPEDAYCRVLVPAQKEVGELWHRGDFSVAEERLVTETTRRLMSLIASRYRPAVITGPTMLAASVAGNAHDIGLRTVSDLFALAGWRCFYLGANVPTPDIASAVRDYGVDLAVLTATLTPQLNALAAAIDAIHATSPGTRILVGGIAFEEAGEVWRRIGADGFAASIDTAVATGQQLLAEPAQPR